MTSTPKASVSSLSPAALQESCGRKAGLGGARPRTACCSPLCRVLPLTRPRGPCWGSSEMTADSSGTLQAPHPPGSRPSCTCFSSQIPTLCPCIDRLGSDQLFQWARELQFTLTSVLYGLASYTGTVGKRPAGRTRNTPSPCGLPGRRGTVDITDRLLGHWGHMAISPGVHLLLSV